MTERKPTALDRFANWLARSTSVWTAERDRLEAEGILLHIQTIEYWVKCVGVGIGANMGYGRLVLTSESIVVFEGGIRILEISLSDPGFAEVL